MLLKGFFKVLNISKRYNIIGRRHNCGTNGQSDCKRSVLGSIGDNAHILHANLKVM